MELTHLTLLIHQPPPLYTLFWQLYTFGTYLFPVFPYLFLGSFLTWSDATWLEFALNWLTIPLLFECLLEGAWYAYFKWFKQPFFYLLLRFFPF